MEKLFCRHCSLMSTPHQNNCKCTHEHSDHVYGGGCKLCGCDCYDQSYLAIAIEKPEKIKEVKVVTDSSMTIESLKVLETQILAGAESLKELTAAQARVDELKRKAAELQESKTGE